MAATMETDPSVYAEVRTPKAPQGAADERLLRLPATLQVVQMGRTMWLDLVKEGKAPAAVKIGRATFWLSSELQSFIAESVRQSRGQR